MDPPGGNIRLGKYLNFRSGEKGKVGTGRKRGIIILINTKTLQCCCLCCYLIILTGFGANYMSQCLCLSVPLSSRGSKNIGANTKPMT